MFRVPVSLSKRRRGGVVRSNFQSHLYRTGREREREFFRRQIDCVSVFRVVVRERRRRRVGPSASPPSRRHEHDGWCSPGECVSGAKRCRARSAVGIDREDIIVVRRQQQQRVLPRRRTPKDHHLRDGRRGWRVGVRVDRCRGRRRWWKWPPHDYQSAIGRRTRSSSSPHPH